MKIAVIGANSRISKYLAEIIKFDGFSRSNIAYDKETIQNKIKNYDIAILAIGLTAGAKDIMYKVNVKILEEILQGLNVKNTIFLSSIAVYGRKNYENYDENSPVIDSAGAHDFYGLTKLMGEKLVAQYSSSYLILRIGTIFGEYYQEYIDMIKLWKKEGPFYFKDGKNKIPFIYARDVAKFIAKNILSSGLVNVTSEGIEFIEIIEAIRQEFNIQEQAYPLYLKIAKKIPIFSIEIAKLLEMYYMNKDKIYPLTLSRSFNIEKALKMGLELTPFRKAIKCFSAYI